MKQEEKIKNIKVPASVKTSAGKQKSKIFNIIFTFLITVILFLNFLNSQLVSSLYLRLVNGDKNAVVSFLEKIKEFPEFERVLEMNKNIYGKSIENEVFRQETEKKLLINNLEQQLTINPKARDILYSLYQLYLAEGDNNKAEEYLRKAKEVDPDIN